MSQAQRVANVTHYLRKHNVDQIGDQAFKIDILLNNQTSVSNGFVSVAPWKSQFVTTPLQDNFQLTALPWLDLLALHEYRHVIQLSSARRGIVKLLYYLFGQESWTGAAHLSLPSWFLEGDAVWAETIQSSQGRGRVASFLEGYRALKISGTKYNYQKARNGSLTDFVPDHYRLGYLMVRYGHKKFGDQFWKDVMLEASAFKGIFYPFSQAIKRNGNLVPSEMYDAMWQQLSDNSRGNQEGKAILQVVPDQPSKRFTDHQYPHLLGDSALVYFERSYDQIGRFRKFNLKTEEVETLVTKGLSIEPYFGGNGKYLTWTEYSTNARWYEENYCDIFQYNVQTREKRRITRSGKFFSPQSSADGSRIICILSDQSMESRLCLIDSESGQKIKELQHDGWIYTYPQFSPDSGKIIAAIRDSVGKMALVEIDMETGGERLVTSFVNRIIGIPEIQDSIVYYSASTEGVENIFGTHIRNGQTFRYTNEPNGAFQAAIIDTQLYYVTFTDKGHVIKRTPIAEPDAEAIGKPFQFDVEVDLLDSVPDKTYSTVRYRPLTKSLNLHTWGLIFEDPEIIARVLSNNVLNNVEFSAGVKYNYDQQNYRPFARLSLAAWYPIIDLEVARLNRSQTIEDALRKWTETNFGGGLSVDWNLTSGKYLRQLRPSVAVNHTLLRGDFNFSFTSLATQVTFQQQRIKAKKNIFTHNGQYLQFRYSRSIDEFAAEQFQVRSALALRGLGVNHNLVIEADYKSDLESAEYQFSNGFNHRGYGVIPGHRAKRFSLDYHFPVFYPDRGFAGLVYFYRVRLNPFFELSEVSDRVAGATTFRSVGGELILDMNMVNEVPFSLGVRYSYPLNENFSPSFELFLPIYRF